jgi:hypothetical protein
VRLGSDVDRAARRFRLQARRNVHGVAEHVELADHPTTNVAGHHAAGVDAHDQVEQVGTVEPPAVFPELLAHLERGRGRRAGTVGRRDRIAEDDHQAVSEVFVDGAAVTASDPIEDLERARHREICAFRADFLGELGEADDVREHHRRSRHPALRIHCGRIGRGALRRAAHCALVPGARFTVPVPWPALVKMVAGVASARPENRAGITTLESEDYIPCKDSGLASGFPPIPRHLESCPHRKTSTY